MLPHYLHSPTSAEDVFNTESLTAAVFVLYFLSYILKAYFGTVSLTNIYIEIDVI